jgi:membrane-bound metal-dependent hydrolase YbcI (DUF457 family)
VFVGHYSAALIAKRYEPSTPLWALVLAVQLVDVAWATLVLLGIERVRIDPTLPSNPLDLVYMPYTHSLPAAILWAGGAWLVARLCGLRPVAALVIACAVASHWVLDWVVHRPDLPLWDDHAKVGLALWNHPLPAFVLEVGLLAGSAWLLSRSPAWAEPARRRRLAVLTGGLVVVQVIFTLGPPPPGGTWVAATGIVAFLAVAWWAARVEGRT